MARHGQATQVHTQAMQAGCIPRVIAASSGSRLRSQEEQEQEQPEAPSLPVSQYRMLINESLINQTHKDILAAKERNKVQQKANMCTARAEKAMTKCEYGTAIDECRIGKELLRAFYESREMSGDEWYCDVRERLESFEEEARRKRRGAGAKDKDARRPRATCAQPAALSQEEQDEQQRKADVLMQELLAEEETTAAVEAKTKTKTKKKKRAKSGGAPPVTDGAAQSLAAAAPAVAGGADGKVAQDKAGVDLEQEAKEEQEGQEAGAGAAAEAPKASAATAMDTRQAGCSADADAAASGLVDGSDGEWQQATGGRCSAGVRMMQDSDGLRGHAAGKGARGAPRYGTEARCGRGSESEATAGARVQQPAPDKACGDEASATMSSGRRSWGSCSQPLSACSQPLSACSQPLSVRRPSTPDAKTRNGSGRASRGGHVCASGRASASNDAERAQEAPAHASGVAHARAARHAGASRPDSQPGSPARHGRQAPGDARQPCRAIQQHTMVGVHGSSAHAAQQCADHGEHRQREHRPDDASESASRQAAGTPGAQGEVPRSKAARVEGPDCLLQRLDSVSGAELETCVADMIAAGVALEVPCRRLACVCACRHACVHAQTPVARSTLGSPTAKFKRCWRFDGLMACGVGLLASACLSMSRPSMKS